MTKASAAPARQLRVGETWRGPTGGIWRVTHVTSDGDAILQAIAGRPRTIRRSSTLPANPKWCQLQQGDDVRP